MKEQNLEIPVWIKMNLTVEEAAKYSNIGENLIREKLKNPNCPFLMMIGKKKLVKRREFEEYNSKNKTFK